jgi:DNA-binding response OmpR family regulator
MFVLVADDDAVLRNLLCDILKKEGYSPIEAEDGEQAIDRFFSDISFDLVILDVMMPKFSGWEVLQTIRAHDEVPILMLTALSDVKHEVEGLDNGADDYIGKPFSYEKLLARINVLLRKRKGEQGKVIEVGDFMIDPAAQKVTLAGVNLELSRKEFQLLHYFMVNPNHVFSREHLLTKIWGYDFEGDIRTIDTHIKTLRAKLGDHGEQIATVRGSGYRFEVKS